LSIVRRQFIKIDPHTAGRVFPRLPHANRKKRKIVEKGKKKFLTLPGINCTPRQSGTPFLILLIYL
jgi:hypothetical protein